MLFELISRILFLNNYLSSPSITLRVKRLKYMIAHISTVLHSSKDLAVSLSVLLRNSSIFSNGAFSLSFESVSARTSHLAVDGCYPLPFRIKSVSVRTFLPVR